MAAVSHVVLTCHCRGIFKVAHNLPKCRRICSSSCVIQHDCFQVLSGNNLLINSLPIYVQLLITLQMGYCKFHPIGGEKGSIAILAGHHIVPSLERHQSGDFALSCASEEGYGLPLCNDDLLSKEVSYFNGLVNGPYIQEFRDAARMAVDIQLFERQPDFTVVMSIHNQADILPKNVMSVLASTTGIWEFVLVFDECSDGSLEQVQKVLKTHLSSLFSLSQENKDRNSAAIPVCQDKFEHMGAEMLVDVPSLLTRIRLMVQPTSVWETSSDNIGMRSSQPLKYYILVQPDMEILELGWNTRLTVPLEIYPDLLAVSARCAHSANGSDLIGRCGQNIDVRLSKEELVTFRNHVHLRDTANRGPLALRADRMVVLGFLDEHNFHLGDDEHDLCYRAYIHFQWRCAYYPIDFIAPLSDGTTRGGQSSTSQQASHHLAKRIALKNVTHINGHYMGMLEHPAPPGVRHISEIDIGFVQKMWRSKIIYALWT